MDPKRFRSKKYTPCHVFSKFPELLSEKPYIGIYNGYNVSVIEKHAIQDVYNEGNFGKGSLSKSAPTRKTVNDLPEIIMQQQWENRLKWKTNSDNIQTVDNRVYIDSIQNLLDSTYTQCDVSWKKWKENKITEGETGCDNTKSEDSIASPSTSNDRRSYDPFINTVEEILLSRKVKGEKPYYKENVNLVLIVEDGEGQLINEESNLSDVKVKLRSLQSMNETLKLNLVEAFFLCFAMGRIKIINEDGVAVSVTDLWTLFSQAEDNFISKYVAYHHYRAHNWTVRSGIKYGGDYLLYKIGPAYYHASYLVLLLDKRNKRRMSWSEFVTLNRLVETCSKDLLLCEILDADVKDKDLTNPNVLKQFSVLEVLSKRWIPSQQRV